MSTSLESRPDHYELSVLRIARQHALTNPRSTSHKTSSVEIDGQKITVKLAKVTLICNRLLTYENLVLPSVSRSASCVSQG